MPSREKRAQRRRGSGVLPALVILTAFVALAIAAMLFSGDPIGGTEEERLPYAYPQDTNFVDQNSATRAPLVLGADIEHMTPEPTAEPEATPTPEPEESAAPAQQSEDSVPTRFFATPMPGDYFLPIMNRAERTPDDEMMIAITIDDCSKADVLSRIIEIADIYSAKLTLFPTGDALMTPGMTEGFRTCVTRLGYEIENRNYGKKAEYTLSSGELAIQMWKQNIAASYAMGRDYHQRYYRPSSVEAVYDQRTHFFARKLGFTGIVGYTYSYNGNTVESLVGTLKSGNIYQFDMTQKSLKVFEGFIAEASRKGYRLVTINELFGMEANQMDGSLTIDTQELPTMDDYQASYYDLKLGYRTNSVIALQKRLIELGYLRTFKNEAGERVNATADGMYGSSTSVAVSELQAKVGIPATGNADVETQQRLFAEDAPRK